MSLLIEMVRDPVLQVKDTAAWTLGRICQHVAEFIDLDVHLHGLVTVLVTGLQDSPKIVSNCCWVRMLSKCL